MGTKAMLTVALTTVIAVSVVDTLSVAEARGAPRELRGTASADEQASSVVRSGDNTDNVSDDNPEEESLSNFDIK